MSLLIEEAEYKLRLLEQIKFDPILILTELFNKKVTDSNFLYQINIDGKYIQDFLKEQLMRLPVFCDCNISMDYCDEIYIELPPLRYGEYSKYQSDDKILSIDCSDKTYKLITQTVELYHNLMVMPTKPELTKIDDYWLKFVDLNYKKRILNAANSFRDTYIRNGEVCKKSLYVKVSDFFLWLSYCGILKKKAEERLQTERERIELINVNNLNSFDTDMIKWQFYLEYAPQHIEKIMKK